MQTETIQFELMFRASPKDVYHLLMDKEKHALITESEVKISDKQDAKFQLWGGYCHGYNIELKEGEKIVQAWHFDEDSWPENHYSICTFEFLPSSEGCKMFFEQLEVPKTSVETLRKGWKEYYWDKMSALIEGRSA